MYNDYYLQSIDSKLNNLDSLITNQNTIIQNQNNLNDTIIEFRHEFGVFEFWVISLLFSILLYHFYHEIFNWK